MQETPRYRPVCTYLTFIAKCFSTLSEFHGNAPGLMRKFGVGSLDLWGFVGWFWLGEGFCGGGGGFWVRALARGEGGGGPACGGFRAFSVLSLMCSSFMYNKKVSFQCLPCALFILRMLTSHLF